MNFSTLVPNLVLFLH